MEGAECPIIVMRSTLSQMTSSGLNCVLCASIDKWKRLKVVFICNGIVMQTIGFFNIMRSKRDKFVG